MNETRGKNRPVLLIQAENIPEAFELAMKSVWKNGISIPTEYDKPGDPPSKDARVEIQIKNPFAQPRFHRAFADGLGGMAEYVQEVVNGAHDYWVRDFNSIAEEIRTGKKVDTKWIYTYHQRLFAYPFRDRNGVIQTMDQIELMAQRLAKDPNTRRAEAITWVPWIDAHLNDPPCLQRVWARIFEDSQGRLFLNMDTDWRSRDLYKAWFENAIAMTTLQARLAKRISELRTQNGLKREVGGYKEAAIVRPGAYTDCSNSLHIYGSYFREIEGNSNRGVKNFFEQLDTRPFSSDDSGNASSRTYTSEQVREFFEDDGCGKGLASMTKREEGKMPAEILNEVREDLSALKDGSYVP
jgi:thymidylate synthase